jgi:beta-N-acetylglucosaminidase
MLVEIRDKQEQQNQDLQKAIQLTTDKRIRKTNAILLKQEGYSRYTDLGNYSAISVEDMNKIIDYYAEHAVHSTAFKGHGKAFIEAANQTGLNPIYLFAHASCESDFGCSNIATDRYNFFGINAVDSNPDAAYAMGDDIDNGIIEGAKWIKRNYYDNGYTTLDAMHRAGYASDPNWASQISALANAAIRLI